MKDAEGQTRIQDKPDGPEFHMKDVDDQTSGQDDAEGKELHTAGTKTAGQARRRQTLWQWNRIHEGGPYYSRRITFSGNEGIQVPVPANATGKDFFKCYIHEGIIDHLVRETNMYTQQYLAKEGDNLRPHSLARNWKETDRAEIIAFLAILILIGIMYKPRLSMFWSKDTLMSTPVFGQLTSRDRFLLLLKFLHFADNRNYNLCDPDCDKLYKVKEVANMIKNNVEKCII